MLLNLEKDLYPEQLVTIKLRNSLNIASTLGKAVCVNFFLANNFIKVKIAQSATSKIKLQAAKDVAQLA